MKGTEMAHPLLLEFVREYLHDPGIDLRDYLHEALLHLIWSDL
jgi:hypothetical protein